MLAGLLQFDRRLLPQCPQPFRSPPPTQARNKPQIQCAHADADAMQQNIVKQIPCPALQPRPKTHRSLVVSHSAFSALPRCSFAVLVLVAFFSWRSIASITAFVDFYRFGAYFSHFFPSCSTFCLLVFFGVGFFRQHVMEG